MSELPGSPRRRVEAARSRADILTPMVTSTPSKKIFLIDAMGFIFRAFYAPMARLNSPGGIPTKVPYLFGNMVRKLLKEAHPDYIAVVFDPPGPTFRDKLFADYKAERPSMPEELASQLPLVRRLCQALRLPMIESPGYEADDVIGALARQAERRDLDVFIVTSDKDLMQLVGGRVLVLRPGQGAGKSDLHRGRRQGRRVDGRAAGKSSGNHGPHGRLH